MKTGDRFDAWEIKNFEHIIAHAYQVLQINHKFTQVFLNGNQDRKVGLLFFDNVNLLYNWTANDHSLKVKDKN